MKAPHERAADISACDCTVGVVSCSPPCDHQRAGDAASARHTVQMMLVDVAATYSALQQLASATRHPSAQAQRIASAASSCSITPWRRISNAWCTRDDPVNRCLCITSGTLQNQLQQRAVGAVQPIKLHDPGPPLRDVGIGWTDAALPFNTIVFPHTDKNTHDLSRSSPQTHSAPAQATQHHEKAQGAAERHRRRRLPKRRLAARDMPRLWQDDPLLTHQRPSPELRRRPSLRRRIQSRHDVVMQ